MIKHELKTNELDIESIFERKKIQEENIISNGLNSKKEDIPLTEQDKQIIFMLENNLLANIAKTEQYGYKLRNEHKEQYYKKLYKYILDNPENAIRDYLKNNIEMPEKFLAICFMIDIQKTGVKSYAWFEIDKKVLSFLDKVIKGLNADPVAKYKAEKIKEKEFINTLFDLWYEMGEKHLNDIEKHVTNKTKFLFFEINKSKSRLKKDIKTFMEYKFQEHIYEGEYFFNIPFKHSQVSSQLSIDKILNAKKLIQRHQKITERLNYMGNELKILNQNAINFLIEKIEVVIKDHYTNKSSDLMEDFNGIKNDQYIDKLVTRNISKNIDKNIDKNLIENLPNEAIKIIEEIKRRSAELSKKEINEETKEMINFLWKDKLPEIIKKYLNIDNEYREKLKSVQGKNAQQLMIESLNVIKESLEHIEQDINEENLKDLSVQNRYLKNRFKK